MILQKRIGSTRLPAGRAFGHEIRKFANVATGLKHSVRRDGWTGQFHNVSQTKPVVQPTLVDARAHSSTDRAEVIETFGPSMDFEGGQEKTSSAKHAVQPLQPFNVRHFACTLPGW